MKHGKQSCLKKTIGDTAVQCYAHDGPLSSMGLVPSKRRPWQQQAKAPFLSDGEEVGIMLDFRTEVPFQGR